MNQHTDPATERVAKAIVGRSLTIDGVLAEFPAMTREQVRSALKNAVRRGLVEIVHKSGKGGTLKPSVYRGVERKPDEPQVRITFRFRASCVWDLGSGVGVKLPQGMGQIFRPLGEWEDTPEQRPGA